MEKSPTYWEELLKLEPAELKDAFQRCAETDISWAIDQAKCLSYYVWDNPDKEAVLYEFANNAADIALKVDNVDSALLALKVCADDPGETGKKAANKIKELLIKMANDNPLRAMDTAHYLGSTSVANSTLSDVTTSFIVDHICHAGNHKTIVSLINSTDEISEDQLTKIIDRAMFLAEENDYESYKLLSEILNSGILSLEEQKRVYDRQQALAEEPNVIKDILHKEYGEDLKVIEAGMAPPPKNPTFH
jgi:hypothetical protein